MAYEGDAFISYAHLDNRVLSDGQTGWVASLQRALETRVAQLVGRDAHVWWDPELRGNDDFSDILIDRLRKVAALVSIVSPGYVNSKWGRRELDGVLPGGRGTRRAADRRARRASSRC